MASRTPKENLKSFSIIYIILAVLYICAVIVCYLIPDVANGLKSSFGNDIFSYFAFGAAVNAIFNLWYFWLCRRVADGKSQGTLYMILLILGAVSGVINAITQQKGIITILSLDVIVDICGLYFLYQARKED